MTKPLVRTEHLSVIYSRGKSNEVHSLVDVGVEIYPEEFVVIYGPSGCGKSTLLHSIASLQMPSEGEVYINDLPLSKFSKRDKLIYRRSGVGMVFQAFYLIDSLSIIDNICLPMVFCNQKKEVRYKDALGLLQRFGIDAQALRYPSQLSGGQKQRVAIARALINSPSIILADEPVGNLDSESAHTVLEILKELNERDKKTIVLVTHDANHLAYGSHIIYLKDGRVLKDEIRRGGHTPLVKKVASSADGLSPDDSLSPEMTVLMRSFHGFPEERISSLLAPFKAKQVMFHLLSELSENQWLSGERFLSDRISGSLDAGRLSELLDANVTRGGADWNHLRVASFTGALEALMSLSSQLKGQSSIEEKVLALGNFLEKRFQLVFSGDSDRKVWESILKSRLESLIGQEEVRLLLDKPVREGGLGLRRQTAARVAREIEIIFLLKY